MTLSVSDDKHLSAWADTGDGYTIKARQFVLSCLWCDYTVTADSQAEAVITYREEHEDPIVQRAQTEHRAFERTTYEG